MTLQSLSILGRVWARPLCRAATCIALFAIPAVQAANNDGREQIVSATLANGMHLIIWPDHNIPSVSLYNFVKVGSRDEVPGKTGLAHFFEHMMFNGTATRTQGEFDRVMESAGGSNNAYTTEDVTVYEDWVPGDALETVFDLEADRLAHLAFVPEVVENERKVVYSERRLRIEDDNEAKLSEQVQAAAYVAHPYGMPVIGWPSDIERWTLDDLKQFFTQHYAPNRCTMVLVGDVDPAQVIMLAKKYFAPVPAQPEPEALRALEPEQQGERRVTVGVPSQTPLLQMAYHIPAANDEHLPALEALMRILTDGDSSRLYQALVEKSHAAISVQGYVMNSFDPGLLWLMVTLPADGDVTRLQTLLDAELQRVVTDGVSDSELNKARNILLAEYWQQMSTLNGKAGALGQYAVFHGDYKKLFTMPDRYAALTKEEVQTAAKAYLQTRNRTVGVIASGKDAAQSEAQP
jgi:zinc protease